MLYNIVRANPLLWDWLLTSANCCPNHMRTVKLDTSPFKNEQNTKEESKWIYFVFKLEDKLLFFSFHLCKEL